MYEGSRYHLKLRRDQDRTVKKVKSLFARGETPSVSHLPTANQLNGCDLQQASGTNRVGRESFRGAFWGQKPSNGTRPLSGQKSSFLDRLHSFRKCVSKQPQTITSCRYSQKVLVATDFSDRNLLSKRRLFRLLFLVTPHPSRHLKSSQFFCPIDRPRMPRLTRRATDVGNDQIEMKIAHQSRHKNYCQDV